MYISTGIATLLFESRPRCQREKGHPTPSQGFTTHWSHEQLRATSTCIKFGHEINEKSETSLARTLLGHTPLPLQRRSLSSEGKVCGRGWNVTATQKLSGQSRKWTRISTQSETSHSMGSTSLMIYFLDFLDQANEVLHQAFKTGYLLEKRSISQTAVWRLQKICIKSGNDIERLAQKKQQLKNKKTSYK